MNLKYRPKALGFGPVIPATTGRRFRRRQQGSPVALQRETAWRDGITHLAKALVQFMQRQVGWRLYGSQIRECYVGFGSASDSKERDLSAVQLTHAPRRQTADCRGWPWPPSSRLWRPSASGHPVVRGYARVRPGPSNAADSPHHVPAEGIDGPRRRLPPSSRSTGPSALHILTGDFLAASAFAASSACFFAAALALPCLISASSTR